MRHSLKFLAIAALWMVAHPTFAQTQSAVVVSACGTPPSTYVAGFAYPVTQDTTGKQCGNGSGGTTTITGNVSVPPYQATTQIASMQKGVATSAAVGLTVPANTKFCNVVPVIANVNWESDGSNPTTGASGGFPMNLGTGVQVSGPVAATIKFINQTGASGALITYECYF